MWLNHCVTPLQFVDVDQGLSAKEVTNKHYLLWQRHMPTIIKTKAGKGWK